MKKKVLMVTEFSKLPTGYSVYSKELLHRMHGEFEVAELACYCSSDDPKINSIPWKVYPNKPLSNTPEYQQYKSSPTAEFGEFSFNSVVLDFQPDFVCVPPETLIHTENGYQPIYTIKVGDKVMSHTGTYRKVIKTMRHQHDGNIVKIKAGGDSQPLELTEEHPVYIYKKQKQTNQKKSYQDIYSGLLPEFVAAKDVKVGDLLVLPSNFQDNSLCIKISDYVSNFISKDHQIYPTRTTNCNPINNNCFIDYDFGTLIGYIIGDGCIQPAGVYITFNKHEVDFANDCVRLFKEIFGLPSSLLFVEDKNCITVNCNSVLLSEFLENFINKKEKKHICAELFNSSKETKMGLIRGLFRSDGCYKSNTISFTSKMKHLAYEVRQLCVDLNIPVSINKSKKAYNIEGYGDSAKLLHGIIEKTNIDKLELVHNPERRPRTTHIINGHMVAAVQRIRKEHYSGQVYNLEVAIDNSYVANWCVHNCDIRDFWMMSFEHNSPFRKFYKHCIMPTVDAMPQNIEWVDTYSQADAVFTYSEFGRDVLLKQNPSIPFQGVASPCASHAFHPIKDKKGLRESFGMEEAPIIIGTVMRNQRRKLYPDLFAAFRKFLDKTKRNDVFLYCHTSYPDVGWDIPSLLIQYNLLNRVLFTYKCSKCNHVSCSFFSDVVKNCNKCKTFNAGICGINNPLSEQELAKVYNVFDIYVQYANSEGFGMPQLEAAQCGNLVMSINYSAMNSVIKNINGIPLSYTSLATEAETGCYRAVPDNECFVNTLHSIIDLDKEAINKMGRECYLNTIMKYNWDKTAAIWMDYIRGADTIPIQESWKSPISIKQPAPFNNLTLPMDQATFLISEVLCKPELIGGYLWRRLLKELTYKATVENLNSFYINEHHYKDALKMKPFTYKDAYDSMVALRTYNNIWEQHRSKYL